MAFVRRRGRPARSPAPLHFVCSFLVTKGLPGAGGASAAATIDGVTAQPLRIVIADDYPNAAQTMSLVIEDACPHAEVFLAFDGAEAVSTVARTAPDVVILDINMPHISGIEAAQRIASLGLPTPPRVIAITGNTYSLAAAGISHLFDHVLTKPYEIQELVRLVTGR